MRVASDKHISTSPLQKSKKVECKLIDQYQPCNMKPGGFWEMFSSHHENS